MRLFDLYVPLKKTTNSLQGNLGVSLSTLHNSQTPATSSTGELKTPAIRLRYRSELPKMKQRIADAHRHRERQSRDPYPARTLKRDRR